MQPYEEAAEERRRNAEGNVKTALNVASAIPYAGSAFVLGKAGNEIIKRIKPFLNEYIPQSLAMKGLNKINSGFGKFFNKAMDDGYDFSEVKEFIKSKLPSKEDGKENNIIHQYSPDLDLYMKERISKGLSPIMAAGTAMFEKKFKEAINKMTKDHKSDWASIVRSVYGDQEEVYPDQRVANEGPTMSAEEIIAQTSPEQMSPGMQKLAQLLQQRQRR